MSSLIDARTAWVTALQTALPAPVTVFTHGGSFDRKQLETYSKRAPALALTLLRFDTVRRGGAFVAEAHWGLIGFTVDTARNDRDSTCVALLEAACKCIASTAAGIGPESGAVGRGQDLVARNLFSFELDRLNVAMWGVEFTQVLDLVTEINSDPFETMRLVWDLAPRDVAGGDGPPDPPVAPDPGDIPEAEDEVELDQG